MTQQRDTTWDAVKGITILLMVASHAACPRFLDNFITLFHMGLFYYVSGIFLKVNGLNGGGKWFCRRLRTLYLPFLGWGMTYVLLHNVLYSIGWNAEAYDLHTTLRRLLLTVSFCDLEPLLYPIWFVESLFKGLVITYAICLLPRRRWQWTVVAVLYLISVYLHARGIHLFYSINREIGIASAIYLGHELRAWSHVVRWWQWAIATAVLAVVSPFVYVAPVNDALGPIFVFPVATLLGVVFVRGVVEFFKLHSDILFRLASWMGRHSLQILLLNFTGFHVLSQILVFAGLGDKAGLSHVTLLPEYARTVWWVPYTVASILVTACYLAIKSKLKGGVECVVKHIRNRERRGCEQS